MEATSVPTGKLETYLSRHLFGLRFHFCRRGFLQGKEVALSLLPREGSRGKDTGTGRVYLQPTTSPISAWAWGEKRTVSEQARRSARTPPGARAGSYLLLRRALGGADLRGEAHGRVGAARTPCARPPARTMPGRVTSAASRRRRRVRISHPAPPAAERSRTQRSGRCACGPASPPAVGPGAPPGPSATVDAAGAWGAAAGRGGEGGGGGRCGTRPPLTFLLGIVAAGRARAGCLRAAARREPSRSWAAWPLPLLPPPDLLGPAAGAVGEPDGTGLGARPLLPPRPPAAGSPSSPAGPPPAPAHWLRGPPRRGPRPE